MAHKLQIFSYYEYKLLIGYRFYICVTYRFSLLVSHSVFSLRAFGRSGYCDPKRRCRCRRCCRRCRCRRHTFVPRQNLRTAIGMDLLFFLNDWYE